MQEFAILTKFFRSLWRPLHHCPS